MNAIPLAAADGTVYAYACGVCRHVVSAGCMLGEHTDEDIARMAEQDRVRAESCCSCSKCGVMLRWYGPDEPLIPLDRPRSYCPACWEGGEREARDAHVAAREAARAVEDAVREAALAKALDRESALELEQAMSDISEDTYCASWSMGLEGWLWRAAQTNDAGRLTAEDVARLKRLSEKCGGWWRWDDEHDVCVFVPTPEWVALYERGGGS